MPEYASINRVLKMFPVLKMLNLEYDKALNMAGFNMRALHSILNMLEKTLTEF